MKWITIILLAMALIGCKNKDKAADSDAGDSEIASEYDKGKVYTIYNTDDDDNEDVIIKWEETESTLAGSLQLEFGKCVAVAESLFGILEIQLGIGYGDGGDINVLNPNAMKSVCGGPNKKAELCKPDHYNVVNVGEGGDKYELQKDKDPKSDWDPKECPAIRPKAKPGSEAAE